MWGMWGDCSPQEGALLSPTEKREDPDKAHGPLMCCSFPCHRASAQSMRQVKDYMRQEPPYTQTEGMEVNVYV